VYGSYFVDGFLDIGTTKPFLWEILDGELESECPFFKSLKTGLGHGTNDRGH